jgi:predicted secreted protein
VSGSFGYPVTPSRHLAVDLKPHYGQLSERLAAVLGAPLGLRHACHLEGSGTATEWNLLDRLLGVLDLLERR